MGFFHKIKEMKEQYKAEVQEQQQLARNIQEQRQRKAEEERLRIQREAEEKEQRIITGLRNSGLMRHVVELLKEEKWFSNSQGSWDSNRRQIIVTPGVVSANDYGEDDYFQVLERLYTSGDATVGIRVSSDRRPRKTSTGRWTTEEIGGELGHRRSELIREKYQDNKSVYVGYESLGYSEITEEETLEYFVKVLRMMLQECYPTLKFSDIHRNYYGLYAFEMFVEEKRMQTLSIEDFK